MGPFVCDNGGVCVSVPPLCIKSGFQISVYLLREGLNLRAGMNLGELNKVWEIKALKKKPREEEARKILEKVANQVQPIMTRRKWRVKLLSEFW